MYLKPCPPPEQRKDPVSIPDHILEAAFKFDEDVSFEGIEKSIDFKKGKTEMKRKCVLEVLIINY